MSPTLYGIGVGPGDPELLTLKAVRLITGAGVVFCPAGVEGRPGRAQLAARAHLAGKRVIALEMEMRGDRQRALTEAAARVVAELGGGVGVYLTEGDPSLYSTFRLLADELDRGAAGVEVRVVPGITALTAAAAAAGVPLAMGEETLAILPASAPMAMIEDALGVFDQTVLLKPSMRREPARSADRRDRPARRRRLSQGRRPRDQSRPRRECASRLDTRRRKCERWQPDTA